MGEKHGVAVRPEIILKRRVINNLMKAHEKMCDTNDVKAIIKLSKFMLNVISKELKEVYEVWPEKSEGKTDKPPNSG